MEAEKCVQFFVALTMVLRNGEVCISRGGKSIHGLTGGAILVLNLVPNPHKKFILQDFTLAMSARKTGENHYFCIS